MVWKISCLLRRPVERQGTARFTHTAAVSTALDPHRHGAPSLQVRARSRTLRHNDTVEQRMAVGIGTLQKQARVVAQ